MRGRSLLYMDVQSANLRSAFAHPQGRSPEGAPFRGVLSLVTFFAQAKKVTRSAEGRVEALHSIDKPPDSGFRRNDEKSAKKVSLDLRPSGSLVFERPGKLDSGFRLRRPRNDEPKKIRAERASYFGAAPAARTGIGTLHSST